MENKRIYHLDALRVLSCFLIVCMHSPMPVGGIGWFNVGLCHFASAGLVMFFIISGALLLPVKEDFSTFLKRRLTKIIIPTLVFTLLLLLIRQINGESISWTKTLLSIPFSKQGHGVYWFVYALIGLYLLTPILSRWLLNTTKKEIEIYLCIWAVTLCFPLLKCFLYIEDDPDSLYYYFIGYAGYFVLGYYLKYYSSSLNYWLILSLGIISYFAPLILKLLNLDYPVGGYLSIFVATMAVALFLTVEKVWKRFETKRHIGNKFKQLLTLTSNLSFGIYLIHIIVMRRILWQLDLIISIENYLTQTFVIIFLTYISCWMLSFLLSFLPYSEFIIGYKQKKSK